MATPIITLAEYRLGLTQLDADFQKVQTNLKATEAQAGQTGTKIADGVKKGTAAIGDMGTEVGRLERTMQRIGERIVAAFAIESIIAYGKASMDVYNEAAQGEAKLLNALNGRVDIQQRLMVQAEEIQARTIIPKDAIVSQQAFLASQGRTEQQIKKTIEAAVQLSAVTGHDLASEVVRLDGTMEGMLRGLTTLDSGFNSLSFEQLKNGAAIDLVLNKYKGFAETAAETGTGPLQQLANKWKETKEGIGEFITNIAEGLATLAQFVVSGFRIPIEHELKTITEDFEAFHKAARQMGGDFSELTDNQLAKYIDSLKNGLNKEQDRMNKLGLETSFSYQQLTKNLKTATEEQEKRVEVHKSEGLTLANLEHALQTQQERLKELTIGSKDYLDTIKKINDLEQQIAKAKPKTAEQLKAEAEKIKSAQKEADKDLIALQGETQKALAAGEQESLQKKMDALEAERIATQLKNEERLTKDLEAYKGNSKKQEEIRKAFNANSLALDNSLAEAQDRLRKEQADKDIQLEGERQIRNKENLDRDFKETQDSLQKIGDARKAKLDEQFAQGLISKREYDRQIIQLDLQTLNDQLKDAERRGQDVTEIKKKIAEDEIKITEQKKERIKEIEQELADSVGSIANGILDLQKSKRDAELSDLQLNYSNQQKALDDQLAKKQISQKNYDKKKAELNKEAQQAENDLKRKNDKAAQDDAIYKILIAAAQAEALDFLSGNFGKAAIDAITAAAQIAIIKATPLPKYAKGTLSVKGGEAGKDSVLAMLTPGEAVMPVKEARQYNKALSAMMDGQFDNYVLKSYLPKLLSAERKASGSMAERMTISAQLNDRRIVKAIKDNKPSGTVVLDDNSINKLAAKLSGTQRTSNLYKRNG